MPLSAPTATAADLLSPKSSELYDIVLVHDRLLLPLLLLLLVLVLVLLLLHLFQCAQIESEFCCSAAPQTAVPPPAPFRGSNNCKQLNNAAKQTKINNNFNFSLSLQLLLLCSLRELFFMARVYLGLFVRCLCVRVSLCVCVCV